MNAIEPQSVWFRLLRLSLHFGWLIGQSQIMDQLSTISPTARGNC